MKFKATADLDSGTCPGRKPKDSQRMTIRFKCPHCTKPLAVKDQLAGKRAACPVCKKPIVIPAPVASPADLEEFAAAALIDPAAPSKEDKPPEYVEFDCPMCGDSIKLPTELAGKNAQCPECRNIIRVPQPKADKPKDWRDINKKGPVAAIINLPEQLDDAWGTEVKGRVSREALEGAGAIEIEVEPVGWRGRIRKLLIAAAVVGAVTLLFFGIRRNREIKHDKDIIAQAREFVKEQEKDPKKKVHPVLVAEIERADGVLQLGQDKPGKAREQFLKARAMIQDNAKDSMVEQDFYLIDLARTQFDMGGTEDEIRANKRIDWDTKVLREVLQTLQRIKSPEAKVIAIRELSSDLIARKQVALAITLATGQYNPAETAKGGVAPMLPQLTALVFAHGDAKKLENLIKYPELKGPLDLSARKAFAEGHARKGECDVADSFVKHQPGLALHKLEAGIGVAAVLLADRSNKDISARAEAFVADALKLLEKNPGLKVPPWQTLQLCRAACRFPHHSAEARKLADKLPAEFKRRAQLEWLQAQLDKGDAKAEALVTELPDQGGAARGLAWVALGRHFGSALPLPDADSEDGPCVVFARIGQALGNREPGK